MSTSSDPVATLRAGGGDSPAPVVRPVFTGAIVATREGSILCQLRDDKPGIHFPGVWTCSPGGHVEAGESPVAAIVRELQEEFEVEVKNLSPLMVWEDFSESMRGAYHAFTADLATPAEALQCHEGQEARFVALDQVLNLDLHPVSKRFFMEYLARLQLRP
jgi:8-oxo-dGTP diphosphatase